MINEILSFGLGALLTGIIAWFLYLRFSRRQIKKQHNLVQRTQRAERLAELGTLTGHLAHEIRNPLSTVRMNLQLLSEDINRLLKDSPDDDSTATLESPRKRYQRHLRKLETITREVERVSNTLNDFLRYAGRLELHPARHDLNEILDDLIDFYEPQASGHQVQIRSSLSSSPAFCRIDKDLIKQAFLNLFMNAIQIMTEGGELLIRTHVRPELVTVEVTDTGPGIPLEQQEKVFDPYFTTRSGGTGLGLPMCRRIIEEHQGHIELHSEPGRGSRFVIELPFAPE